jgi:hypothetical protein
MMNSRKMRWVRHLGRMGEMRSAYIMFFGRTEGRNYPEDLGADEGKYEIGS